MNFSLSRTEGAIYFIFRAKIIAFEKVPQQLRHTQLVCFLLVEVEQEVENCFGVLTRFITLFADDFLVDFVVEHLINFPPQR